MTRIHRACGQPLHAVVACSHCGAELEARRVRVEKMPEPAAAT